MKPEEVKALTDEQLRIKAAWELIELSDDLIDIQRVVWYDGRGHVWQIAWGHEIVEDKSAPRAITRASILAMDPS